MRPSTLLFHVTQRLLYTKWRDPGEEPKLHLFGQLKRITKQWLDTCLVCKGGTYPGAAHVSGSWPTWPASASPPASPARSWASARSRPCSIPTTPPAPPCTSASTPRKTDRWETDARRCHINWVILDSDWEGRVLPRGRVASARAGLREEPQPRPRSALPLRLGDAQVYRPDFIVLVDDGHGDDDLSAPDRRDQRATGARTRRKRNPRWRPTGCPA